MNNKKILQNASWIFVGRIFQMALSLLTGIITARFLGPSNYGLINYSASYIAFFNAVCALGLDSITVNEVISHPEDEEEIVSTIIFLRVAAGCIGVVLVQVIVMLMNPGQSLLYEINFLQSLQLVFTAFNTITYWLQSKLESKTTSIIHSFAYFLVFLYKVWILVTRKSVIWFAASNTIDLLVVAIMLFAVYRKKKMHIRIDMRRIGALLAKSKPFLFSAVMLVVYQQTDKIMLGKMMDTKAVGLYSAALRLCDIYAFVPVAIIDTLRPVIVSAKKESGHQYERRMIQAYGSLIWVSIICCSLVTGFSGLGMSIVYGVEYLSAAPTLSIAIWYTGFSYIGSINNVWLICENKQKYVSAITLVGAITNVILNSILIPMIGINGAAIATLFTQVTSNIVFIMIVKELRPLVSFMRKGFSLKRVIDCWRN